MKKLLLVALVATLLPMLNGCSGDDKKGSTQEPGKLEQIEKAPEIKGGDLIKKM